ncbi:DNA polymerase III subunit gamma/tau [Elusimicrobiota bacterium]
MSYQVLARKYRPQNLEEVVGQDHISRTLRNALIENRVAHAYLFSGPRGVGKTTMARILAKALNCKDLKNNEPCGECPNCVEIANSTSVDVQEIDGASNRGIDEIRALRENVKFAPATSKYKIYIIDEAHQITDQAFNALLKTLEEPPSHVVFILATTEVHKIPITILSRCQRYRFRLLSPKEIMGHLEDLVRKENFQIDTQALQIITTASGGSVRDSLSLLDQAVSFVSEKVTADDMQNLLGFLPKEIISSVADYLGREDLSGVLTSIKEVNDQGYNLLQFGRDLREYFRNILLLRVSPDLLNTTPEEQKLLVTHRDLFSDAWLIRSGHLISRALNEMKWHDNPRIILELYLLRMAQPYVNGRELIEKIEQLEKNSSYKEEKETGNYSVKSVITSDSETLKKKESKKIDSAVPEKKKEESNVDFSSNKQDVGPAWEKVVNKLQEARPLLATYLINSSYRGFSDNSISIAASTKFEENGIKHNMAIIQDCLKEELGFPVSIRVIIDPEMGKKANNDSPVKEEIIVEEENQPVQNKEYFEVKEDITDGDGSVPRNLEKIVSKFPGQITKKKK